MFPWVDIWKKKLKKIIVRCPYKDFFGHRFRKKNNSIFGPFTIIPQKTVDQSSEATFEYLSGKKKFVQIGRLLFEIWAKTCRRISKKARPQLRLEWKQYFYLFLAKFYISVNNFWTIHRAKMAGYFLEMQFYALFTLCYNIFCQPIPI